MTDQPMPGDPDQSVDFRIVHAEELQRLAWRRRRVLLQDEDAVQPDEGRSAAANAHRMKPFGLAFSGGGIRSATFNLGILQGLAEHDLLRRVDYLSTVSGGGYIGSWLHGFIKHHCDSDMTEATCRLSPTRKPVEGPSMEDPIAFLRKYSNYLAPSPGLFSADTWVIAAIWLRNVLLNQLILLPALAIPMLVASLAVFGQIKVTEFTNAGWVSDTFHISAALLAAAGLVVAACGAALNLRPIVRRTLPEEPSKGGPLPKAKDWFEAGVNKGLRRPLARLVVPLLFIVAAILGCADLGRGSVSVRALADPFGFGLGVIAAFAVPYFVLGSGGGFIKYFRAMHGRTNRSTARACLYLVLMSLAASALSFWLLHEVLALSREWAPWNRVAFVPVMVCLAVHAGVVLLVGLMGADYPDGAREWVARIGTGLTLVSAAWLALFAIAIWGPWAVAWSLAHYGMTTLTALAGWVATTAFGVKAGRSASSGAVEPEAKPKSGQIVRVLVAVAPTVFMIGYLLLISVGVHTAVDALLGVPMTAAADTPAVPGRLKVDVTVPEATTPIEISVNRSGGRSSLEQWLGKAGVFAGSYFNLYALPIATGAGWLTLFIVVCGGVVALASRRININEFSLHHFYKNRLVRCYLGASHGRNRQPNPLTGFDPADDFPLSVLRSDEGDTPEACKYTGPYPIVNTTLNLNVGAELAQQERKGASFVFTPEYCGFDPPASTVDARPSWLDHFDKEGGYRRTTGGTYGYSAPEGPTIGQALAISGAAANPNSGCATTNAMAFLLTVFDARLGWWLGNPRWRKASSKPGPSFALGSLLSELFAQTNARSKYINLSDGGHFDNLGLYELVRRRCRYIIIGDGEQDGELTFGSLGGAIRKCRADFGVEIAIDPTPIRLQANGRSKVHCVVGTITYPELDEAQPAPMTQANDEDKFGGVKEATARARGWILYLKSSLTGDEPADVIEYQSRNPQFPHQSTGDQFFSESQFESYRRLGLHVVREAFEGVTRKVGDVNTWTAPPAAVLAAGKASVAADRQAMQKCRDTSPFTATKIDLTGIFQKLTTKWYPGIPLTHEAASRLNSEYSDMVKRLGENGLAPLLPEMLADRAGQPPWPGAPPDDQRFVFMVEQLGLMENVFTEFGLEHAANRANPRNRGWMRVFRQWVHSDQFYDGLWPRVRNSYNPLFQKFVDELKEKIDDVPTQN